MCWLLVTVWWEGSRWHLWLPGPLRPSDSSHLTQFQEILYTEPFSYFAQLLPPCYGIRCVVQEEAVVSKLKVRREVGTALCGVMHEGVVKCCEQGLWTVREARKFWRKKEKSFAPSFFLQVKALLHSPAFPILLTFHLCFHIYWHRTVIFFFQLRLPPDQGS